MIKNAFLHILGYCTCVSVLLIIGAKIRKNKQLLLSLQIINHTETDLQSKMNIAKAFEVAFNRKKEKNWEKIYVVVDIHDTILRASYENEETYDYYPYAREALQLMSNRDDICMILWSGCYEEKMAEYRSHFAENGIHFDYVNENPEVRKTSFQNFETKLYFNVGIDDKFGFEAETDWVKVIEAIGKE